MLLFIWPFIRSTVLVVVYPSVLVSFFRLLLLQTYSIVLLFIYASLSNALQFQFQKIISNLLSNNLLDECLSTGELLWKKLYWASLFVFSSVCVLPQRKHFYIFVCVLEKIKAKPQRKVFVKFFGIIYGLPVVGVYVIFYNFRVGGQKLVEPNDL